jgi:NADH-quinone oxidoreductase subunit L
VLYYKNKAIIEQWKQSPDRMSVYEFLYKGWQFDELYDALFVRPFVFVTQINKADFFDRLYKGIALGANG